MRRIWIIGSGKSSKIEEFLKLAGLGCEEIRRTSSYACAKGFESHVIISVNDEKAAQDCRRELPSAKIILLKDQWTVERLRKEQEAGPWDELLSWSYHPTDREKTRLENAVRKHLAGVPAYKPE